jgi:hypothetical protein
MVKLKQKTGVSFRSVEGAHIVCHDEIGAFHRCDRLHRRLLQEWLSGFQGGNLCLAVALPHQGN